MPIGETAVKDLYEVASEPDFNFDDEKKLNEIAEHISEGEDTKYKFEAIKIEELTSSIVSDLSVFEDISDLIDDCTHKNDDKLHRLQKLLDKYAGKKVLVYSEFSTTIQYLYDYVKSKDKTERVYAELSNTMKWLTFYFV